MLTSAKAKTAIMVAVLIAIVIGALSWFFLISPKFEEAADIADQAQALEDRNKVEAVRIEDLKARHARMGDLIVEIAEYQEHIPVEAKIDEFSDYVVSAAADNEVYLYALGFQPGTIITADNAPALPPTLQAEREAAEAAAAEAAKESEDDEDSSTSSPEATPLIEGFYGIQNEVTVIGPKDNVFNFLQALQLPSTRHNLVFEYSLLSLPEAEGSGGRPDIEPGDVELTIVGMIYVLADPLGIVEQPAAPSTPLQPAGENNPFMPLPENLSSAGSAASGED